MTSSHYAISFYPISPQFKNQLENKLGTPINYLIVEQLRQQPLRQLFLFLRSLELNCLLFPIECENYNLLLPILKLFSFPIPAKEIKVVFRDLTFKTFYKSELAAQFLKLMGYTFRAGASYAKNFIEIKNLINKSSMPYRDNAKQHVLYLDSTVWLRPVSGGSVGHVSGVVNALVRQAYSVDYAALLKLPLLSPQVNFIPIRPPKLFVVPMALNRFSLNNHMISQLSAHSNHYQFIYQRMAACNYTGVKLSKKFKIPLVIEFNGSPLWTQKNWGQRGILNFDKHEERCEMTCFRNAHLIVAISDVLKEQLIDMKIPSEKIFCYPNGIDPGLFNPALFSANMKSNLRTELNIPQQALVFTFIGTFGPWHGISILAGAIKKLIDQHLPLMEKYQIRFLLIGNGVEMPKAQTILNKPDYLPYVIFTDTIPQEKAPEYLAISDVFLSPQIANADGSRFFGSPTKLFEYMSMEKPIIASDLEQLGQILRNSLRAQQLPEGFPNENSNELGLLCEPGNIDHIIQAVIFLCQNPAWRTVLGGNARKEVLEKYTWDKNVTLFLEQLHCIAQ